MLKSFNSANRGRRAWDTAGILRIVVGVLLVASVVATGLVLWPPGGSAEDLDRQLTSLTAQVASRTRQLEQSKLHAASIDRGRSEGDQFLTDYFLASRTASSTVVSELDNAASVAKITPREHAYNLEPIEGSDTLMRMSVTASYEGTYANLLRFVHELDRSPRLIIIESLTAAPMQGSEQLTVSLKLDTFVRDDGSGTGVGAAGQ
jgi:Tfp pilus assembly protein PilO